MKQAQRSFLVDIKRCVGCGACMEACMQAHGLEGDYSQVTDLSANALTVVVEREGQYVRKMCMHCLHPTCVSVCPVAALHNGDGGSVVYDASRCIGCRYCMQACPFNVPRYEWSSTVPAVAKCDMCAERWKKGEITACAEACPESATVYGTREEMLAEAHRRIAEDPDGYYPHVFGEHEVGGTSVLVISPVPFDQLGFPGKLPKEPLPERTWAALSHVPDVISIGGALLLGIWWITKRRQEVAEAEESEHLAAAMPVAPEEAKNVTGKKTT
jgi:formate dehydrogenase iron-sulfur subunit